MGSLAEKRVAAIFLAIVAAGPLLVLACDTDNGDTAHGPDIGALPDSGRRRLPDGAIVEADGAPVVGDDDDIAGDDDDVTEGGPTSCAAGGTAALVAGNDGALTGAVRNKGGAWVSAVIGGGGAKSKPSLVAFGAGFLGVTRGGGDALQSFSHDGTKWTGATAIGTGGVKGPPTLAVAGTKAHVVFSGGAGTNTDYTHGIHDGTKWNAVTDLVGTGGEHSFGGVSAGLAAIGNDVFFAQNGSDQGLYARPYTGGSWKAAIAVTGAGTVGTDPLVPATIATPEVVALKGKYDLVIIYEYKKQQPSDPNAIAYATHEPGGTPEWGNPDTKFVSGGLSGEKFNAAALGDTSLALAFKGDDGNGYYSIGTATTDAASPINWTAPAPIGGSPTPVDTAPAVAKGDCGNDAIFAFQSGGKVKVTSVRGGAFTAIAEVPGVSGPNVAIATR
ncbi:MAG: hypothetical protein U0270_12905 [Labilithrix sp.]